MEKIYIDYQIAGIYRGDLEIGAILFEDGEFVQIKDKAEHVLCYGNSYSSRDYMDLNIAIFEDTGAPLNLIYYKIEREDIDFEKKVAGKETLSVSIPNHLKDEAEAIIAKFRNPNITVSETKVEARYGDIKDFLVSEDSVQKVLKDHVDMDIDTFVKECA